MASKVNIFDLTGGISGEDFVSVTQGVSLAFSALTQPEDLIALKADLQSQGELRDAGTRRRPWCCIAMAHSARRADAWRTSWPARGSPTYAAINSASRCGERLAGRLPSSSTASPALSPRTGRQCSSTRGRPKIFRGAACPTLTAHPLPDVISGKMKKLPLPEDDFNRGVVLFGYDAAQARQFAELLSTRPWHNVAYVSASFKELR
jgi:hypothetical protein